MLNLNSDTAIGAPGNSRSDVVAIAADLGILSGSGTQADPWKGWDGITWAGQYYWLRDGWFEFTTFPNLYIDRLALFGSANTVLKHTGTGAGVSIVNPTLADIRVIRMGNFFIAGNANTTYGLYAKQVSHSLFDNIRVLGPATSSAAQFEACLNSVLRDLCSTSNESGMSVGPLHGLTLASSGGVTCNGLVVANPIFQGLAGNGLNFTGATHALVLGGDASGNVSGVFTGATSWFNEFINTWVEANSTADIDCDGYYNRFTNISSGGVIRVSNGATGAAGNIFDGGDRNTINIAGGVGNKIINGRVRTALGTFTDNGTNTIIENVFDTVAGAFLPNTSMRNLLSFANNAAAIAGGLPVGAAYLITGADTLGIVH